MKKTDQTVEEMIMRSHYLNALELESGAEEPLSDMEREAFLETMQDLKEIIKNSNDMIRSLQDTIRNLQSELDRSRSHSEQYLTLISDLRSMIADLQNKLDLRDLNNRHNKMTFGNKSTGRKFKRPTQKRSRDEEKKKRKSARALLRQTRKRQIPMFQKSPWIKPR